MPTIGFWNFNRNNNVRLASHLVYEYGIEILILAEEAFNPNLLVLDYADLTGQTLYHVKPISGTARISFYSLFPPETVHYRSEIAYVGFVEYLPVRGETVLIAGAHLPSKSQLKSSTQFVEAENARDEIERLEREQNHSRTVIVGDLNMDPFEEGIVKTRGFHAVMDRRLAEEDRRTVLHNEYTFFYNPMWRLMGDSSSAALGTYFSRKSEHVWYFWNTLDQVLVRPALLNAFEDADLRIIHSIAGQSLLAKTGIGLDRSISDHLPVMFKLNT